MAAKLDPKSDRVEACWRAADALREKYGSVNKAALATGLVQQTLNSLLKDRKLGIEFADQLAAEYETTIDGLIWLFLREGNSAVRAGNIPGWSRAAYDAEVEWPDYPYGAAADILLPLAPRQATKEFARDLAQVLYVHAKTSHQRISVKLAKP
jgi:hypothetical protein